MTVLIMSKHVCEGVYVGLLSAASTEFTLTVIVSCITACYGSASLGLGADRYVPVAVCIRGKCGSKLVSMLCSISACALVIYVKLVKSIILLCSCAALVLGAGRCVPVTLFIVCNLSCELVGVLCSVSTCANVIDIKSMSLE